MGLSSHQKVSKNRLFISNKYICLATSILVAIFRYGSGSDRMCLIAVVGVTHVGGQVRLHTDVCHSGRRGTPGVRSLVRLRV
jgi:hypothetical protein